jgi:hypothetical protein
MFKKLKLFFPWVSYKLAEIRNVYTHKAVGQRQAKNGETLIMYTILGKRDLYDTSINKLMSDQKLLERFHPCQAAKFGAIALGDTLFSLPTEQQKPRYKKIKEKMLAPDDKGKHQQPTSQDQKNAVNSDS